jgi:NTE family protein
MDANASSTANAGAKSDTRHSAKQSSRAVSLALQGGGSHGAYAWGVLDYLTEDGRLDLRAITATSAGAMNAVTYAYGMEIGGPDKAREAMEAFWSTVSRRGAYLRPPRAMRPFFGGSGPFTPYAFFQAMTSVVSPYDTNPLGLNPLKEALTSVVDFEVLNGCQKTKLFISATNVRSGHVRVFKTHEITADAVMASACLPQVFKAVEIDGEPYWDGGYMGNPSLFPLYYDDTPGDILIVHINPIERATTPRTAGEITDRLNEITFNASLMSELRSIAFVQKMLDENWLADRIRNRYRRLFLHAIRADDQLDDLGVETKFDTSWDFLCDLRDKGRAAARDWLDGHFDKLGKVSTVDVRAEFLERGG